MDRHPFDADTGPYFHFDADPVPNFHLMPIQIRIRIRNGIKTMPIHMRILPQVLQYIYWKIGRKNVYFYTQQCQFTMFFLCYRWQTYHDFKYSISDSILNFFLKKVKNTCAWSLYRSGSGQMMRIRPDPDPDPQHWLIGMSHIVSGEWTLIVTREEGRGAIYLSTCTVAISR